jgi:hypothetical protein
VPAYVGNRTDGENGIALSLRRHRPRLGGDDGEGRSLPPCKKLTNKSGAIAVPIRRLLENHAFGPDEIQILTTAFEDTLRTLRLADRADPATEIIARKIIELAQQGERDPDRLRERAIQLLSQ